MYVPVVGLDLAILQAESERTLEDERARSLAAVAALEARLAAAEAEARQMRLSLDAEAASRGAAEVLVANLKAQVAQLQARTLNQRSERGSRPECSIVVRSDDQQVSPLSNYRCQLECRRQCCVVTSSTGSTHTVRVQHACSHMSAPILLNLLLRTTEQKVVLPSFQVR